MLNPKNGGNQIVALGFPAKNSKFKMAALKTGCACKLAINAPTLVILVYYIYEVKEYKKIYFKCKTIIFSDENIKNMNFKVK